MSKLCPKCQYLVGAPLISNTALILLDMEVTRAAQVIDGIFFSSSMMTSRNCWMLDTWCFSTFRWRMPHMCSIGFRSGDILGHSITFSCHLGGVFGVVILENSFWRGGGGGASSSASECHSTCWIHVSLNEPQLPSTSSRHAAQTMMRPPARLTVGKAEVSWYSSPGRRHTCWTPSESNKFTLDLIRPQDMVPVIHALGQVVFSKLFAGFLVSQL